MPAYRWDDLPAEVRAAITAGCGPVLNVTSLSGGLTAGLAARLDTAAGRMFLKALPESSPSAPLYRRERLVGAALPEGVPAPRLLWSGHTAGWVTLLIEHVDAAREVELGPGAPDLHGVLELVRVLGETLSPNPGAQVPPVVDNVRFLVRRADALLADRPSDLPAAHAYRHARGLLDMDALAGSTLLHADLHEGNLLACPAGVGAFGRWRSSSA